METNNYSDDQIGRARVLDTPELEAYYKELETLGVKYHQIVMDCGRGTRVVLNDMDPENPIERAVGINFIRDGGFEPIGGIPDIKSYEL